MFIKKAFFLLLILATSLVLTGCSFSLNGSGQSGAPSISGGLYKSQDRGEVWAPKNNFSGLGKVKLNIHKISFGLAGPKVLYAGTNLGFFVSEDSADNWRPLIPNADIADFALNPKTKSIIYVASGNKIYKTADSGAQWDVVYTEVRPNISIKSVAVDYFDTSRVYLLANDGTMLVSLDWGNSWKSLYSFGRSATRLLIDQYHDKNLYVVADNGLYHSTDSGASWQEIIAQQAKEFPGINNFKNLFFINKEGSLIYLSRYGLLRSQDSAKTWSPIQLVSPPNTIDIETFNYNPHDQNEIYYILEDVLYHTFDGGRTWQTRALPASGKFKASNILVDPEDSDILYLSLTQ
jgi:photosystem II stability/assembly factor-like uncharacterized protein